MARTTFLCDRLLADLEIETTIPEKKKTQNIPNLCCLDTPSTCVSGRETPKLDIHCHIMPASMPDWQAQFGYGGFIQLKKSPLRDDRKEMWKGDDFFREVDAKCYDIEARMADMDASHVRVQILSTVPVLFAYFAKPKDGLAVSRYLNDDLARKVSQYPHRLAALGTVPMQHIPYAVMELKRCMNELNFVGVEIATHIGKYNLDDKRFDPFWQTCSDLNACVFVHPWDMMGMDTMKKYWLPWLVSMPAESSRAICSLMFGGIFKKYPKIRFCFAHGGGSFPHTVGRIQHGYDCRPDLIQINLRGDKESPMKWLGHFWTDSLVHSSDAFDYLKKTIGLNRIVMGTDYPFPLGECYPLKWQGQLVECHSKLTPKEKRQILWENGLELIGKTENDFKSLKGTAEDEEREEEKSETLS